MERKSMGIAQKEVPRTPVGNRGARVGTNVMEKLMRNAKQGGPEGPMGRRKERAGEQEENTAFSEKIKELRMGDDGDSYHRECIFAPF